MSDEDLYWERTAFYGFFATEYGWTKAQVDDQPYWYTSRLAGFAAVLAEVKDEAQRKAAR